MRRNLHHRENRGHRGFDRFLRVLCVLCALCVWFEWASGSEFDLQSLKTLTAHHDNVLTLAFSPDGSALASGSSDHTIGLWRPSDGTLLKILEGHTGAVNSVDISPDGSLVLSGSDDNSVRIWKLSTGALLRTLQSHTQPVLAVAFSPDKLTVASSSADGTVTVWQISDGKLLRTLTGHEGPVQTIDFSPDGIILASAGDDRSINFWRVSDGSHLRTLRGHKDVIWSVAFNPEGSLLASASGDRTVKLWNVDDCQLVRTMKGNTNGLLCVAFSPDGSNVAATSYDKTVKLWRVSDAQLWMLKRWHTDAVRSIAFSPDGSLLATGSKDETVRLTRLIPDLWELPTPPKAIDPAFLAAQISFSDSTGDLSFDAGETASIEALVTNSGKGDAYNISPAIRLDSPVPGLTVGPALPVEQLTAGSQARLRFPLRAGMQLPDGQARFNIQITEGNGFDLDTPLSIVIPTRAFKPPKIALADVGIDDASGNGIIDPGEVVTVTARLQNQGQGLAKGVTVKVEPGGNVFTPRESQTEFTVGSLEPGAYTDVLFQVFTNNRANDLPVTLAVTEARWKYDVRLPFNLTLGKMVRPESALIVEAPPDAPAPIPDVGTLSIDVDLNIPKTKLVNKDAIAVLIGNEDYAGDVPDVLYAGHDIAVLKEYLVRTLGFKESNVILKNNAGLEFFQSWFGSTGQPNGRLASLVKPGRSDLFFYYTGHGAPGRVVTQPDSAAEGSASEIAWKPYLVPVDCAPTDVVSGGYALDLLCERLEQMSARSVTILLDAGFSGIGNDGKAMLETTVQSDLPLFDDTLCFLPSTIFLAASPGEIASWLPEKKHSLFTYCFLKGLQGAADADSDGRITTGEIHEYLSDPAQGVIFWSRRTYNGRIQTPMFRGDPARILR
jgi:WD40 repeat protein